MLIAQSLVDDAELSDQIIIPVHLFHELINEFEEESVLYVNLIHTEYNIKYLVTIPSSHDENPQTIYVPSWILDLLGHSLDPIYQIEKADTSDLPVATRILIKPLDPAVFDLDLISGCEQAFMNLHSIQQDITLPIQILDQTFFVHIEQVDPMPLARIIEGEVTVEFINMFEKIIENPKEEPHKEPQEEPAEEPTVEERRQQIRESWLKRFPS